MFHGWITQFNDPGSADGMQQGLTLLLPILLATLAVYARSVLSGPSGSQRPAVVAYDRQRLGDRRFSSARLWFSAFAPQTAAALGIETHQLGEDVLDLELISIQETILQSAAGVEPDEDFEALEWLTGHFRRELLNEETESIDRPALSSCWIAFGTLTTIGFGLRSRAVAELRFVNAGDLGRQAFVSVTWANLDRRIGRHRQPLAGLVREPDAGLLVDHVERMPPVVPGKLILLSEGGPDDGLSRRLLTCADHDDTEAVLSDRFVGVAQTARQSIHASWGDHWWTAGSDWNGGERTVSAARCQLFTDVPAPKLRRAASPDRDSTIATA